MHCSLSNNLFKNTISCNIENLALFAGTEQEERLEPVARELSLTLVLEGLVF